MEMQKHRFVIENSSFVIYPGKGPFLYARVSALLVALGLFSPALVLAQNGPGSAPFNTTSKPFYDGGVPRANLPQQRESRDEDDDVAARKDQPVITGELFEPGEVLAVVGDQYILAGDVLPHVNQVLEPFL